MKIALPLTLGVSALLAPLGFGHSHVVRSVADLSALAPQLAGTTGDHAKPLHVHLAAGTYVMQDSVRILRSHVTLSGDPGSRLLLADGVNEPVIVVGTQSATPTPEDTIRSITIRDLDIDGNRIAQSSETSLVRPWIRNNGIDVRAVTGLVVERVSAINNRSGGLVISWGCADVQVRESTFAGNHFDGIAFYASTGVTVEECVLTRNCAAGVSLDNDFRDSTFSRCLISGNGDVGIFVRHSRGLRFEDCTISSSGNWAVFLGHDENQHGVSGISISDCRIKTNRGGVFLASLNPRQSSAVRVSRTTFAGNHVDGRTDVFTCGADLEVTDEVAATAPPDSVPASVAPATTLGLL